MIGCSSSEDTESLQGLSGRLRGSAPVEAPVDAVAAAAIGCCTIWDCDVAVMGRCADVVIVAAAATAADVGALGEWPRAAWFEAIVFGLDGWFSGPGDVISSLPVCCFRSLLVVGNAG